MNDSKRVDSSNGASDQTVDAAAMRNNAKTASALLKQLANEHRLLILCTLLEEEMSVGELNKAVNLSQSSLSQHLASLRNAGLVKTRREAQSIYYSIDGHIAPQIIGTLHEIFCKSP